MSATPAPSYRFQFAIIDESTGDVVASDFCGLTHIEDSGSSDSVDMHVSSTLRWFKRIGQREHERENHWPRCFYCGSPQQTITLRVDHELTCDDCAPVEQAREREENSQFGVGA